MAVAPSRVRGKLVVVETFCFLLAISAWGGIVRTKSHRIDGVQMFAALATPAMSM